MKVAWAISQNCSSISEYHNHHFNRNLITSSVHVDQVKMIDWALLSEQYALRTLTRSSTPELRQNFLRQKSSFWESQNISGSEISFLFQTLGSRPPTSAFTSKKPFYMRRSALISNLMAIWFQFASRSFEICTLNLSSRDRFPLNFRVYGLI